MKKFALLVTVVLGLPPAAVRADEPAVKFVQRDQKIDVLLGGKFFTSYLYPDTLPKQVLYPVHTPAGVLVCRGYPLRDVAGESKDHPHHAGIFFACDQVNGNSFWLNIARAPYIQHVQLRGLEEKDGQGRLSTLHRWIAKNGTPLLEEARTTVFRAGKEAHVVDFIADLKALKERVVFEDTKEGLFAIRVADWMREQFDKKVGVVGISGTGTGKYSSANGDMGEKGVWGKRSHWVALEASKDGKQVGVAIFCHPKTVNAPTYWHARGYGLFAANPLGQGVFEKDRKLPDARPLRLTLEPGQSAHFHFRVLVYDGTRTAKELEQEFAEFRK